jgi:ribosome maturation factor RimP
VSSAKQDAVRDRIAAELVDPLSALALDIEAVEITPAGKRRIVRIAVDKDGGVTLDDVADATRAVSEVLDESDTLGEMPYTLEVTSRGVDRPLTLPRHWRRNADRLVKVTLADDSVVTGRITDSDDESVTLDVDGSPSEIRYADITRALVQIEFNRKGRKQADPEIDPETDHDDEHDEEGEI